MTVRTADSSSTSSSTSGSSPSRASQTNSYTVKRGDNLSHIARDHGVSLQSVIDANPQLRDPNMIHVGQRLNLPGGQAEAGGAAAPGAPGSPPTPSKPADGQYIVRPGDNLSSIAQAHGTSLQSVLDANRQLRDPNLIHPGQQINIPGREGVGASHAGRGRSSTPPSSPIVHGGVDPAMSRSRIENGAEPLLSRGSNGPEVERLQGRLGELGFNPGPTDGDFGPRTQDAVRAFQRSQSLPPDGSVGASTWNALRNPDMAAIEEAQRPYAPGNYPKLQVYEPGSREQVALFQEAARMIGAPESWASSSGLHNILRRESGGRVGVPNYTYGDRARDPSQWSSIHDELRQGNITARSSATGLGQLLLGNVDRYYPNGRAGIGDPLQEAAGMLAYIRDRYGNPDRAWELYGTRHEGY